MVTEVASDLGISKEVILHIKECDVGTFTKESMSKLIDEIKMMCGIKTIKDTECKKAFIPPEPKDLGWSAVWMVFGNSILIHTFVRSREAFVSIFTQDDFNARHVGYFIQRWFGAMACDKTVITLD